MVNILKMSLFQILSMIEEELYLSLIPLFKVSMANSGKDTNSS